MWKRAIPTQEGKYWAFSAYDGEVMPVIVKLQDGYVTICNTSEHPIMFVGPMFPRKDSDVIFTHFMPFTEERPKEFPPRFRVGEKFWSCSPSSESVSYDPDAQPPLPWYGQILQMNKGRYRLARIVEDGPPDDDPNASAWVCGHELHDTREEAVQNFFTDYEHWIKRKEAELERRKAWLEMNRSKIIAGEEVV